MGCKHSALYDFQNKMCSKGGGGFFISYSSYFLEFRYDGYTSISQLWPWGERCMLRRVGQQDSGAWLPNNVVTLLTNPDPPTFGIPLHECDSHEKVFHRTSSTWRVNDQDTQLLHFNFYHPNFHWGHDSHGLLPTNGSVLWRDMGVPVSHPTMALMNVP